MKFHIFSVVLFLMTQTAFSSGNTPDYYVVLGVSKSATQNEIRTAFRKLALQYHPDKNLDQPEKAEKKFKEINSAYQVLGNEDKRKNYDQGLDYFDPFDSNDAPNPNQVRPEANLNEIAAEIKNMVESRRSISITTFGVAGRIIQERLGWSELGLSPSPELFNKIYELVTQYHPLVNGLRGIAGEVIGRAGFELMADWADSESNQDRAYLLSIVNLWKNLYVKAAQSGLNTEHLRNLLLLAEKRMGQQYFPRKQNQPIISSTSSTFTCQATLTRDGVTTQIPIEISVKISIK